MRAVDTNVLVRLIARDDRKQAESAEDFVSKGAWVSHLVLAETSWVLDSVYDLRPEQIATAVEMLLNHEHLTMQDSAVVAAALENFRQSSRDRLLRQPDRRDRAQERPHARGHVRS